MVQQMWNQYMPLSNESGCGLSRCDGLNILGFQANVAIPQTSNFGVAKLDHNFGDKWKFFASYRYFNLRMPRLQQVDIGGFTPGARWVCRSRSPTLRSSRGSWSAGLTPTCRTSWTNSIRYSYLRNWWAVGPVRRSSAVPRSGRSARAVRRTRTQALAPYNVNTQQTRTRFWDGQDNMIRDDATWIHGKHMVQFGGMYQHNFNWHSRTDNGGGINYYPTYQLGTEPAAHGLTGMQGYTPTPTSTRVRPRPWDRDYAAMLGIVSDLADRLHPYRQQPDP